MEKLRKIIVNHNIRGRYKFINRGKGFRKLCLYLIGYKKDLWPEVVRRFKKFIPEDIDVCLISSGVYLNELEDLAKDNSWSYLSTRRNNVCLVQNIAINLFPKAELIYKIDEDIFLTEGTFEKMEHALEYVESNQPFHVGMVSPLLNINAYGYYRILEKIEKLSEYEKRFGKPYMESGRKSPIESNIDLAKFMWGADGIVPNIDELNKMFTGALPALCPVRLSIGCILYKRSFWESFWRFPVLLGHGMGYDEAIMLAATLIISQVLIIAEDSVVGHFSYGSQTKEMMQFYRERPELFHL